MNSKMWVSLSLVAVLVVKTNAEIVTFTPEQVKEGFMAFRVSPQVIPSPPATGLIDIFGDIQSRLGNRIPPWCTTTPPYTTWVNAESNALYTELAIDPDYPQYFSANGTQFLHALIVNIPGLKTEEGDIVSPFIPCSPLPGSGDHRYVCLIYKQPARISVTNELLTSISKNIRSFSVVDFATRYKLGNPVAGGVFRSRQPLYELPEEEEKTDCVKCYTSGQKCLS